MEVFVMAINERNGLLFFDFRYRSVRCREYTKLPDSSANRKGMQKVMEKIEAEIILDTFSYATYFPNSKRAPLFAKTDVKTTVVSGALTYSKFSETWFAENKVLWRNSHASTVRSTIDLHLVPWFGKISVADVTKEETLKMRSHIATLKGRGNNKLAPKTVNRIMQIHSQIMGEAAERYDFTDPTERIKRIKQQRVDISPLSLEEAQLVINTVRSDFRDYMIVRLFTGMRTGEIHGLQWKYIDFDRRQILIRRALVRDQLEYTKTDGSQREIDMSNIVYDALKRQEKSTREYSDFVFCNSEGQPLDLNNVTNRVWYPLLANLGLEKRRPYQTRHSAATIWLGAGENPEWVARQLGHTNTEMLFKTYSRFIPNLTRKDGAAMNSLLISKIAVNTANISKRSLSVEQSRSPMSEGVTQ